MGMGVVRPDMWIGQILKVCECHTKQLGLSHKVGEPRQVFKPTNDMTSIALDWHCIIF